MDITLIDNWNQSVGKDDQVFFLGDFGLGDVDHLHSICSQLNLYVEVWDYKPVAEKTILSLLDKTSKTEIS